ncbi:MAG: DUF4369 domain-containing protein [Bacteroidales bacterium]|nr:DUF4369 domain-containing protein [Bacteroidales bacterium]
MRIRIIVSVLVLAVSLCSCGQKGYTIKGDIIDLDEGNINLLDITGHVISSTDVADGKFTFKGKVDTPCLVYINNVLGVKYPIDIPVLLENTTIHVTGDARINHIDITGTKANENMVRFKIRKDKLPAGDNDAYLRLVKETFEENKDNLLGAMLISNFYGLVSDRELLEYCDMLPEEFHDNIYVEHYRKVAQARVDTEPGNKFKDFEMLDSDSLKVGLGDVVRAHEATVVLFWASWARDASAVIPDITAGCLPYRKLGLEMYNVSLDSDMTRFKNCEKEYGIFGLSFANGPEVGDKASSLYGFEGLPRVLLIDKEGTIVARGRSFDELALPLKTLFAQ